MIDYWMKHSFELAVYNENTAADIITLHYPYPCCEDSGEMGFGFRFRNSCSSPEQVIYFYLSSIVMHVKDSSLPVLTAK